jgi:hypothetical protein
MLLEDIVKYKSTWSKPYHSESVTNTYKTVKLAKKTAESYAIQVGIAAMSYSIQCDILKLEKKRIEALKKSIDGIAERFHEKF